MPEEFITFAKADLRSGTAHGLVNGLSNAKRAIDCQADIFILAMGLSPHERELTKQLGPAGVALLAALQAGAKGPLKFQLLQTLGVATPAIVARMRKLRNALEHEYRKPRRNDVNDAIDVAELFVQACAGKMRSVLESFGFGSGVSISRGQLLTPPGSKLVARDLYLSFKVEPAPHFEVCFWDQKCVVKQRAPESPSINVGAGDDGFLSLLRLLWRTDWYNDMTEPLAEFLTEVGVSFPRSKFRARSWDGC